MYLGVFLMRVPYCACRGSFPAYDFLASIAKRYFVSLFATDWILSQDKRKIFRSILVILSVKPSFLYGLTKLSKFSSVEKVNDFSPSVCWSRHNATERRNLALCFALIGVYKCQILSLFIRPPLVLINRNSKGLVYCRNMKYSVQCFECRSAFARNVKPQRQSPYFGSTPTL